MNIIEKIKGIVIVSVQAMPNEPLYDKTCMEAMMKSVINGGAKALRVAGDRDIKLAKELNVPVIGITKPNKLPDNWKEVVYITPTLEDIKNVINAGADIIAFDGTQRPRPNNEKLSDVIDYIHKQGKLAMADIATLEDGINAQKLGVDIVSTTLAGYTMESVNSPKDEPDYELLKNLVKNTNLPVILEGRIWEPEQVKKAFDYGAHCVVIGSAITRPQLITKRFVNMELQ